MNNENKEQIENKGQNIQMNNKGKQKQKQKQKIKSDENKK